NTVSRIDFTFAWRSRLHRHGAGEYAVADSETIQSPRSTARNLAEIGRTGSGLVLRWWRYHFQWWSFGVKEIGGANRNCAALRRLLHRLSQNRSDRAPSVGSDRTAR